MVYFNYNKNHVVLILNKQHVPITSSIYKIIKNVWIYHITQKKTIFN